MATIQIADDVHPKHLIDQTRSVADGVDLVRTNTSMSQDDGIYNIRSRTRGRSAHPGFNRTLSTLSKDEDPGIRRDGDLKRAQVFSGKMLFLLAYQSVGVIYGDISTSTLYVFSSTFTEAPNKEDLVGVLSLIIWSLTMMVTLKYVLIILHADNDGEGGTFSTYALLSRYTNITNRDPREASLVRMGRWASGDLESAGRKMREGLESSKIVRGLLKVMGLLAVSMVISDGVLTPAQSVLGAVQGAEVITILFAPIVIIWLAFNAVFGVYNLVKFDATVFKAFNPGYAFQYLIHHKEVGWRHLGGVLLCFTGVEALFADLGAFSRRAIQFSWLCYVYPCLILAYVGQAAYISVHPEAYSNPFFNAAPPGTIYPALIIAVLAAVVASQAIITATFQLLAQVMKLSYFPQLKVIHTSQVFHGQLYVPLANWLLMIGTILIASVYNNTTSLGNAYGVCVIFVTFFDSIMCTLVAVFVWRYSPFLVVLPFLTIICMDLTFLSSALTKVPDGAWFTLTLAAVLASVFLVWRYGKEQQWFAEAEDRFPTSHFIQHNALNELSLTDRFDGTPMSQIKGFGMFFDKAGETTPIVFSNFALKLTATTEIMVFFHLRPLERPSVPSEERHTVSRLAVPCCYRLVVRYGYNDEVVTPNLAAVVHEQVKLYIMNERAKGAQRKRSTVRPIYSPDEKAETPINNMDVDEEEDEAWHNKLHDERLSDELAKLDRAFDHKVLYIIGKEQMKTKEGTNWVRRALLETFLWMRDNTRTKMANLNVPKDKVIEIGFLKEI